MNQLQKQLLTIIRYGIFATPFIALIIFFFPIPFMVNGNAVQIGFDLFFPFITSKAFVFRFIVEAICIAWLCLAIIDKQYRPKWSPITIAIGVFTLITFIANLSGLDPLKSMWSNFERMEGFVTIAHLAVYFLVATAVLPAKGSWSFEKLWNVSLVASGLGIVYGLFELINAFGTHSPGERLEGPLGNAIYFACYMLVHFFIAAWQLIKTKARNVQIAYGVLMVFQVIILYNTQTRGAMLGLVGGLIVSAILVLIFEKERKNLWRSALVGILAIIVLIGGFIAIRNTDFVKESRALSRFADISWNASGQARQYIWPIAWQGFLENPILGVGQENFNFVFNAHYNPKMFAHEQWFDRTHNVFIDWLSATGILGFAAYMTLWVLLIVMLWRSKLNVSEKALLTGAIVAYGINNIFVFDNLVSYIFFFTMLAYIDTVSEKRKSIAFLNTFAEAKAAYRKPIIIGGIIVFLCVFWVLNADIFRSNRLLVKAISPQSTVQKNLEYFKEAIAIDGPMNQEIREQVSNIATQVARAPEAPQEIKQSFYDFGVQELLRQIEDRPGDARHYLFLAFTTQAFDDNKNAILAYKSALELSPKKQTILMGLGQTLFRMGSTTEALKVLEHAHLLEPSILDVRNSYAFALMYAGLDDKAGQLLAEGGPVEPKVIVTIAKIYQDLKKYQLALDTLNAVIELHPGDPSLRMLKAEILLSIGNKNGAIAELRAIDSQNPDYGPMAETFIAAIQKGENPFIK